MIISRRAEPALQRVVFLECRLDWVQGAAFRSEALDGRDGRAIGHYRKHRAGFDSLPVDVDSACTALGRVAADMSASQVKIVAYEIYQKLPRFDGDGAPDTVDYDRHWVKLFVGFEHANLLSRNRASSALQMSNAKTLDG